MGDRAHQAELRGRLAEVDERDFPLSILMWVVPAGGKSRLPGILAQKFPDHKVGWFVPRLSLRVQAVEDFQKDFGFALREADNEVNPTRGCRGFVTTHQALCSQPDLWEHEFRRHRYVLVVDEHHHAKIGRDDTPQSLCRALDRLRPHADVTLFMTGTLETNDNTFIYGAEYDEVNGGWRIDPERSADVYIRYDRPTALEEGAIVPIEFLHHDGPVRWQTASGVERDERLSDVGRADEAAAIYTALRTDVAAQLFAGGLAHWRSHPDAGKLIVVTDRQSTAQDYYLRLQREGIPAALAIDDNAKAHAEVRDFRKGVVKRVMVTCQMAYEGLNVPEATHLICLTHIRSVPWIEQMLARVWRAHPGKKCCWAFMPDDPRMNRIIQRIAAEVPARVRDRMGDGPGGGLPNSVLALGGSVDAVRREYLDESFAADAVRQQVVEFARRNGLSGDEPEVEALARILNRPPPPTPGPADDCTHRERERWLRKQIADECASVDAAVSRLRGIDPPEWGETGRRLIELTGKRLKDMDLEELQRAHTQLQTLRPR